MTRISERIKGTSSAIFECDECRKQYKGNYYNLIKKDVHLCGSCSCKDGWRKKNQKRKDNIPYKYRRHLIKRYDGKGLDEYLPKRATIKIIIRCECGKEKRSNAYQLYEGKIKCNSCAQRGIEYDYSYRKSQSYRDNMSKSLTGHKVSKETRKKISKYWEKIRGCSLEEYHDEWNLYRRIVYRLTERVYRKHKSIINPDDIPRGRHEYHLDHKFSVLEGWKRGILPYYLSLPHNLQMLKEKENIAKDFKCSITEEELYSGV